MSKKLKKEMCFGENKIFIQSSKLICLVLYITMIKLYHNRLPTFWRKLCFWKSSYKKISKKYCWLDDNKVHVQELDDMNSTKSGTIQSSRPIRARSLCSDQLDIDSKRDLFGTTM